MIRAWLFSQRQTLRAVGALMLGWSLNATEAGSPSYTVQQWTADVAGGLASSTHYRLVSSVGLPGGLSASADRQVRDRRGFIGVLNDPPRAQPDTVRSGADFLARMRVSGLLGNDLDPEADGMALRGFDPVSVAGGRVSRDGAWLLYEPPTPFPGTDAFGYTVEDTAGNVAAARVTVLVAEPGLAPSQNLIAIAGLPDGHKYVAFAGIADRTYTIERADQLPASRWEVLASLAADRRGLIEWVDPTEPAPPQRYYRTRSP